jgi:YVTN family beta-propeller protein
VKEWARRLAQVGLNIRQIEGSVGYQLVEVLGQGAHGVSIDPTGRHAYVTNIYGDDLAVLDLLERRVVATLPMGAAPNGVSFTATAPRPAPAAEIVVALPDHSEGEAHPKDEAHGEGNGHAEGENHTDEP